MDPIGTKILKSDNMVYVPKAVQTMSLAVSDETSNKLPADTLNKSPVNIFGEVPVKKQIVLVDQAKISKTNKVPGQIVSKNTDEKDVSKDIMNGVSIAADGVSTILDKFDFIKLSYIDALNVFHWSILDGIDLNFLDGIDVLGVQSLKVVASGLRLGVNYKDLRKHLRNNDEHNSAWDVLSMAKGTWALVEGGFKTASASTAFGASVGMNSLQTAANLGAKSKTVSNIGFKVAIPLALANTGLEIWDLVDDNKKVSIKEKELEKVLIERHVNPNNSKEIKGETVGEKEKKIRNEIGVLKTNTKIMEASVGFSSVSTASLIASVVFPASSKITTPVFMVGNVLASVSHSLSDDQVRTKIVNTYKDVKSKYAEINNDVNRFLVR